MYENAMKTLIEGGLVKEIEKELKKDWLYMPVTKKIG